MLGYWKNAPLALAPLIRRGVNLQCGHLGVSLGLGIELCGFLDVRA